MAREFDLVIIGGGLTGSAAACLFARQGLAVAQVDRGGNSDNADPRVSAINLAAANLFKALEVWQSLAPARIGAYRAMKVWDQNSAAKIAFHADDLGEDSLGAIVANRDLVAAMREKLRQNYRVALVDNAEITAIERPNDGANDARIGVELSGEWVETKLLIGADGANSKVRELAGLATQRRDFGQDAIVAEVAVAGGHRQTAWQCFLATGPAALLPQADGRCALVWSCERELAAQLMALPAEDFCARLGELFGDELGEIGGLGDDCPRRRFPLAQHHAAGYIADSIALIGDAAHAVHPLAGLGANLGLVDAAALAEVVEAAQNRGAAIGQYSVLRRFERWRRGDNAAAMALLAALHDLFGSQNPAAKAARAAGFNLADALAPLKTALAGFASGVCGDLPKICRRV